MKGYLLFFFLFFCTSEILSQSCIDTIFVSYEPFDLNFRVPSTLNELRKIGYTDTITNINAINSIFDGYSKILRTSNKREKTAQGIKMICTLSIGGVRLKEFYYLGGRIFYSDGYAYANDFGLLSILLNAMKSGDKFKLEIENKIKDH